MTRTAYQNYREYGEAVYVVPDGVFCELKQKKKKK